MKSILIFCFLLAFAAAKGQNVRPLLHLATGQTYYLQSTSTSAAIQMVRGVESRVNTTISFKIALKVIAQTDAVYTLEARYQSLEMNIRLADTALRMSSELSSKPDTPSAIMSKIVNKSFPVKLNSGGKILTISTLDKLISGAFSDFSSMDSVKKKKVTDQFTGAFGEASLKGMLEMGIAVLPGKPIAKNDQWEQNGTISSPALAGIHSIYRLIDITPDFYLIQGHGTITAGKDAKPGELDGMPAKYELDGSLQEEIKIDKKTGWIIGIELKQLIEENIEITDNPKVPGGMTIPMMFTTDMTISDKP